MITLYHLLKLRQSIWLVPMKLTTFLLLLPRSANRKDADSRAIREIRRNAKLGKQPPLLRLLNKVPLRLLNPFSMQLPVYNLPCRLVVWLWPLLLR
jgi:hypothetical protein